MSTYAGSNSYPATITIPDPNQPATAGTVDSPVQDLANRTTFLAARISAHAESQAPLKYECVDGDNIIFQPVYAAATYDTQPRYLEIATPTTITKTAIEGGVPPIGSRTYYIYLYWDLGAGAPRFQLSLTVPDAYRVYKSTGPAHLLVGIAQTSAAAKFVKVRGVRHSVWLLEPPQVLPPTAAPLGNQFDLSPRLPLIADTVTLGCNALTNISVPGAIQAFAALSPNGITPSDFKRLLLPSGLAGARASEPVEIPLGADKIVKFETNAATTNLEAYLRGYTW